MKSILLHIAADDEVDGRFQVALDLCRAFGAHLSCLYVTPYSAYATLDPFGGGIGMGTILEDLHKSEAELRARLESRLSHEDVAWDWSSVNGDPVSSVVAATALADLVILGQSCPTDKRLGRPLPIVDDVAVHAGCAVLVVPKGVNQMRIGGSVVIGWNASPEAAHAIKAAMPLLKTASSVHIASVGDADAAFPQTDANAYLSRHGISSDIHQLAGTRGNAATILHDFATGKHATCLVIGAYGRSRLRETLLGGVTRNLLSSAVVPLLLAH
jgi:nucleotide-binding universal stress UspA family protein